jgi:hypothetical protein
VKKVFSPDWVCTLADCATIGFAGAADADADADAAPLKSSAEATADTPMLTPRRFRAARPEGREGLVIRFSRE